MPPQQEAPVPQTQEQVPQLPGSDCVLVQTPSQQAWPVPQAVPQLQQLLGSLR